jgi:hypothetical protein
MQRRRVDLLTSPTPTSWSTSTCCASERQTTDTIVDPGDKVRRVNPLNWDGKGRQEGLLPPRRGTEPKP